MVLGPPAPDRSLGSEAGHVFHRGQLGTGSIPWQEFFAALDEVGYGGTITFESFSSAVVHPTLSSNLAIWRNLWKDSEDLARGARAFLREQWGG